MLSRFVGKLMELAEKDSNVLYLLADSGTGYDEMFKKNFPNQLINFGISEENMVAASAGLASCGKIPFVCTSGSFLSYRAIEFIRDDVCFADANVKIVGMGSGLSWGNLGPTHHTTEDISMLRSLPNLKILSASSPMQAGACVEEAYKYKGPVYIRMEMTGEKEFFDEDYVLSDSNDIIRDGNDVLIITMGSILEEVDKACDLLRKDNVDVKLLNVHNIKPFDIVNDLANIKNNKIFIIEDHNVMGGLGSMVADEIATNGICKKVVKIGLNDKFAEGYGTVSQVRKRNGLDYESIYNKIKVEL